MQTLHEVGEQLFSLRLGTESCLQPQRPASTAWLLQIADWFLVGNGGMGCWGTFKGLSQGSIPRFPTENQGAYFLRGSSEREALSFLQT